MSYKIISSKPDNNKVIILLDEPFYHDNVYISILGHSNSIIDGTYYIKGVSVDQKTFQLDIKTDIKGEGGFIKIEDPNFIFNNIPSTLNEYNNQNIDFKTTKYLVPQQVVLGYTAELDQTKNKTKIYYCADMTKECQSSKGSKNVWVNARNYTNEYELLNIVNTHYDKVKKEFVNTSFFRMNEYKPISRAYFKIEEITVRFIDNFISQSKFSDFKVVGLAEGPGGMMEYYMRRLYNENKKRDHKFYAITKLFTSSGQTFKDFRKSLSDNNIPNKNNLFIYKENTEINSNIEGDLTYSSEIDDFVNTVGRNSVNLITADGAFGPLESKEIFKNLGYKFNYDQIENNKEQTHLLLFWGQIISALALQKKGGVFIMKIFDRFTFPTVKILQFLSSFYEKFIITKPLTSRAGNSESYIILYNFKYSNITDSYWSTLKSSLDNMRESKLLIQDIIINNQPIILDQQFVTNLSNYNILQVKYQINELNKTLKLANMFYSLYSNIIQDKYFKLPVNNGLKLDKKSKDKLEMELKQLQKELRLIQIKKAEYYLSEFYYK